MPSSYAARGTFLRLELFSSEENFLQQLSRYVFVRAVPTALFHLSGNGNLQRGRVHAGVGRVCAVGELTATGVAGSAVLHLGGGIDSGLIHSSAESLH